MFTVTEEERAAIRRAYDKGGEWGAVAEMRRHLSIRQEASETKEGCGATPL